MSNIVNKFLSEFSVKNKEDGKIYAVDREGDLYEFIRVEVHEGYLPDNFKFQSVYFALEDLTLQDQTSLDVPVIEADTNYTDLNEWAARPISRTYLNEVLEQQAHFGSISSYFDLMVRAQQMELDEISCKVYQFVQDQLEKFQAHEDDSENEWEA